MLEENYRPKGFVESEREEVQVRVHGPATSPTLIYLPGVHGDWTLIGDFRRALGEQVHFVEVTYPRVTTWTLADYAGAVEEELRQNGVSRGWLLGESFGSQIVWQILEHGTFCAEGVILAGGFARHPAPWMAHFAAQLIGVMPFKLLRAFLYLYVQAARIRFRNSAETRCEIEEFVVRRTASDCSAIEHRLELVAHADPRQVAQSITLPIYGLCGLFDPIVPWLPTRRWLRRNCPGLCEYRLIACADHNVLGTASKSAAEQVLRWITMPPARGRRGSLRRSRSW